MSNREVQVSDDTLALLRCPKTGGQLTRAEHDGKPALICREAGLAYPIEDGLPVLVPAAAVEIED